MPEFSPIMHAIHTFLLLPLLGSRFVENQELLKECSDFDRRNVSIIQAAMTVRSPEGFRRLGRVHQGIAARLSN